MTFDPHLSERKTTIDDALLDHLHQAVGLGLLDDIIRDSILVGGSRIRPLLFLETCEAMGLSSELTLGAACSLEILHASSLVLDDLPCMDNASLRRDHETCHKKYGIQAAELAAASMQFIAIKLLEDNISKLIDAALLKSDADTVVMTWLAQAIDRAVSGQALDLRETCSTKREVLSLYEFKTAAFFEFVTKLGGLLASANESEIELLAHFGLSFGVAYQLRDDLADVGVVTLPSKKDLFKDASKPTYVSLYGTSSAIEELSNLLCQCANALTLVGAKAASLYRLLEVIRV